MSFDVTFVDPDAGSTAMMEAGILSRGPPVGATLYAQPDANNAAAVSTAMQNAAIRIRGAADIQQN